MEDAFNGLFSRLDITIEIVSELENIPIEFLKTRRQREKTKNRKMPKKSGITMKSNKYYGNTRGRRIYKAIFEAIMLEYFPQINIRHNTTYRSRKLREQ